MHDAWGKAAACTLTRDAVAQKAYALGRRELMKIVFSILGVLMVVMGAIWFLQGINVLPGSFMTGQIKWAVYGACMVVAGLIVLARANRRLVR